MTHMPTHERCNNEFHKTLIYTENKTLNFICGLFSPLFFFCVDSFSSLSHRHPKRFYSLSLSIYIQNISKATTFRREKTFILREKKNARLLRNNTPATNYYRVVLVVFPPFGFAR